MKLLHSAITIATSVCIATAAPACAQEAPQRIIHLADLDLGTATGVHILHNRLEGALTGVCGDPYERELSMRHIIDKCRKTVMRQVGPQIAAAIERGRHLASTQTTRSLTAP